MHKEYRALNRRRREKGRKRRRRSGENTDIVSLLSKSSHLLHGMVKQFRLPLDAAHRIFRELRLWGSGVQDGGMDGGRVEEEDVSEDVLQRADPPEDGGIEANALGGDIQQAHFPREDDEEEEVSEVMLQRANPPEDGGIEANALGGDIQQAHFPREDQYGGEQARLHLDEHRHKDNDENDDIQQAHFPLEDPHARLNLDEHRHKDNDDNDDESDNSSMGVGGAGTEEDNAVGGLLERGVEVGMEKLAIRHGDGSDLPLPLHGEEVLNDNVGTADAGLLNTIGSSEQHEKQPQEHQQQPREPGDMVQRAEQQRDEPGEEPTMVDKEQPVVRDIDETVQMAEEQHDDEVREGHDDDVMTESNVVTVDIKELHRSLIVPRYGSNDTDGNEAAIRQGPMPRPAPYRPRTRFQSKNENDMIKMGDDMTRLGDGNNASCEDGATAPAQSLPAAAKGGNNSNDDEEEYHESMDMNLVHHMCSTTVDESTGLPVQELTVICGATETLYDFRIDIRQSTIPNAGNGAFLTYLGARVLKRKAAERSQRLLGEHDDVEVATRQHLVVTTLGGRNMSVQLTGNNLHYNNNNIYWTNARKEKYLQADDSSTDFDENEVPCGVHEEVEKLRRKVPDGEAIGFLGIHNLSDYRRDNAKQFWSHPHAFELGRYGPHR